MPNGDSKATSGEVAPYSRGLALAASVRGLPASVISATLHLPAAIA